MSIFSTRVGLQSIVIALLLIFNSILLIRDYQNTKVTTNLKKEITNLSSKLHDAAIKARVFESNAIFGSTFVPHFSITDLQGEKTELPHFGNQNMLMLFFKVSDCRVCLESMGVFKATVSSVPIVGVALEGSVSEVKRIKQEFKYEFPVFLSLDSSFQMNKSPNSVLIDRNRNILSISKIDPGSEPVEELINQINEITERR